MRTSFLCGMILSLLLSSCNGQIVSDPKTIYNKDFKWTIVIPENFNFIEPSEWEKLQNRGIDAIEETIGEEVESQAKTIFVFKNGDFNYLESNYQPYDIDADGDYIETCRGVNEIFYQTLESQMPDAVIDTISSVEKISGLEFQTFKLNATMPNGMIIHMIMYSRLFGEKELSVNVTYVNEVEGKRMIEAWSSSKFE